MSVDERFKHLKPGDRVRFTIEGIVDRYDANDGMVRVKGGNWLDPNEFDWRTEVIEPVYEHGEDYRDAGRTVYRYGAGDSLSPHGWLYGNSWCSFNVPIRPLVKLVPEGSQ